MISREPHVDYSRPAPAPSDIRRAGIEVHTWRGAVPATVYGRAWGSLTPHERNEIRRSSRHLAISEGACGLPPLWLEEEPTG